MGASKQSVKEKFGRFVELYKQSRVRQPAREETGISYHTLKKIETGSNDGFDVERALLVEAERFLDSTYRCSVCGVVDKRVGGQARFRPQPANRRASVCFQCDNEMSKKRRCSLETFAIDRAHQVGKRCPDSTLTAEDIITLWTRQEGKSYYSGMPMQLGEKNAMLCVSVDRKLPDKPYSLENCVLCTHRENTMKGNMTDADFVRLCGAIVGHCDV
jgi:hypothetical protein